MEVLKGINAAALVAIVGQLEGLSDQVMSFG
jgi:hypothetical protein